MPTTEAASDLVGLHREFWTAFLPLASPKTPRFANNRPRGDHFISAQSGERGVYYVYIAQVETSGVCLDIGSNPGPQAYNKAVFDHLAGSRSQIEAVYGRPLMWTRLDDKLASRVFDVELPGGCRSPRGQWPAIHRAMIEAMTRFEAAIAPHLPAATAHASKLLA